MDPVAHTLVGAAAAEAGLRRLSRHATATLVIGANLPDLDALATPLGQDVSLLVRRGWTHGVLAMAVLPAVLIGCVALWHRLRPPPDADGPPFRIGRIAFLAYAATWSHPLLDLLNTYGVRLLMPFDERWFYGDALFIIDPWFWLMTAAGVVLARSRGRRAIVGWIVLGILASALMFVAPMVSAGVKVGWCAGVAGITILRVRRPASASPAHVARLGLAALLLYLGLAVGLARVAESTAAAAEAARTGERPAETQSNPVPGNPFAHRLVLVHDDRFRVVPPDDNPFDVPRADWPEVVRRAADDPSVRGFMGWTRYPYWEIEETAAGSVVTFRDLRYVDPGKPALGIGLATVVVPRAVPGRPPAPWPTATTKRSESRHSSGSDGQ